MKRVERTVRIGVLFGAKHYTYWVARDGLEVPETVDWKNFYKWLEDGLNAVYDYIQAKKFTNHISAVYGTWRASWRDG